MLGNSHFRYGIIRKLVVAFGSLFNDIDIIRFDNNGNAKERFKVPISYGAKEKYITRITSDPTMTKSINTIVPRMSFGMESIIYDANRKQISTIQNFSQKTLTGIHTQYVPIPYNFNFNLSLYVRNIEDGTQILEQILPFFTPDFTISLDFADGMNRTYDIPIILNDINPPIEYEGDMSDTRFIVWDLTFTVKAMILAPVKDGKLIRSANVNIYKDETMNTNNKIINIHTVPNPITANANDVYTYTETITEYDNA